MLDQELHFLLLRAFHHSNRLITQQITALGLCPGQPKILEYLLEHDGCIARDICRDCVLDKSTMTNLLGRMERQGLIEREENGQDKRASFLRLTDQGRVLAEQAKEIFRKTDARAARNLSPEEQAQLARLLKTVTLNLEEETE